jgi:hypothetical protein
MIGDLVAEMVHGGEQEGCQGSLHASLLQPDRAHVCMGSLRVCMSCTGEARLYSLQRTFNVILLLRPLCRSALGKNSDAKEEEQNSKKARQKRK